LNNGLGRSMSGLSALAFFVMHIILGLSVRGSEEPSMLWE